MIREKKTAPKCEFGAASSKACAWNFPRRYYIKFPAKCKPQSGQGRRVSSVSFGMLLAYIGAAGLVSQLARLIDWMER